MRSTTGYRRTPDNKVERSSGSSSPGWSAGERSERMIGGRQTRSTSGCRSRSPRPKPERLASRGSAGGRPQVSQALQADHRWAQAVTRRQGGWSVDCVRRSRAPPRRPRRAPGRPRALSRWAQLSPTGGGQERRLCIRVRQRKDTTIRLPPFEHYAGRTSASPAIAGRLGCYASSLSMPSRSFGHG